MVSVEMIQSFNHTRGVALYVPCPQRYDKLVELRQCQGCENHRGRDGNEVHCGFTGQQIMRSVHPKNTLNDLAGNEWLFFTKSVLQTSYPAAYGQNLRRQHGANKPPQLMAHIIKFFTKPGQTVLDPFAGVGGTLIGATLSGRKGTGIELNPRWIELYRRVCRQEKLAEQEMIGGDCLTVLEELSADGRQFDFAVTDPPYGVALRKTLAGDRYAEQHANRRTDFDYFSEDPRDLRNLATFEEYYRAIGEMAGKVRPLLKPRGYFALIIRDSYQDSEYVMASYEVSRRVQAAGFVMKGIKVWYGTGARVRPYGYPYAYVPYIVHQNLLIFRR